MATKAKYRLNEADQTIIDHAVVHDKQPEVVKRATAIRLLHLGYKVKEVADMLVVDQGSIYGWHRRWRQGGLEGLANHPRSGRPRKAGGNYRELLEQTLANPPAEAGYDFAIWTIERLRQHMLDETGIDLSNERLRILLQEMGYVYRRPKQDLTALQNSAARADAEAMLEDLKNAPNEAILSFSLWTKQP